MINFPSVVQTKLRPNILNYYGYIVRNFIDSHKIAVCC